MNRRKRVVLGMSGGVDSSMSAWLLDRAGYEVIGVTFRMPRFGPESRAAAERDLADARRVAERIGIRHRAVDVAGEFDRVVIAPFVEEYRRGRTPNPCVLCNREMKFRLLREIARAEGAEKIATGHYARVLSRDGRPVLARALHRPKDQSYFLCRLSPEQIAALVLPLGALSKEEIRRTAAAIGLAVHDKAESQEVCFAPPGRHAELLEARLPGGGLRGEIVDLEGRVLGEHRGVEFYTIGQRRGLGIGGGGTPFYVVALDPASRRVVVGRDSDLFHRRMLVENCVWSAEEPQEGDRLEGQIRHRHRAASARVVSRENGGRIRIEFDEPQRAITPGQAAAFYRGDIVIGGGWIAAAGGEEKRVEGS